MATTQDYIEYVCEQLPKQGTIRYKKMFGEYMVYINDKPILIVCDNTVYVKQKEELTDLMKDAKQGYPYKGAKAHYVLDIDNKELSEKVISILEPITPLPKSKKNNK